jgi:hypothetical protein
LADFFKKTGRLPADLSALWEPDGLKIGGPLSHALDRLDAEHAGMAAVSVPDEHLARFVGLVAESAARDPAKQGALTELVKKLDAGAIGSLLATNHEAILRLFPPPQPQITTRLEQLLDNVLTSPNKFQIRLQALIAGQVYLPRTAASRINTLVQFRDAIKVVVSFPEPKKGMFGAQKNSELGIALDRLLDVIQHLFDDIPTPPASNSTLELLKAAMNSRLDTPAATVWHTVGRALLARQVQRMDDTQLVQLLSGEAASDWLKEYPLDNPILAERLRKILSELSDDPMQFERRMAALLSARKLIPDEHFRMEAWNKVLQQLKRIRRESEEHPEKFADSALAPPEFLREMESFVKAVRGPLEGKVWVEDNDVKNQHIITNLCTAFIEERVLDTVKSFRGMLLHYFRMQ